jgi:hypothetical protein
VCVSYLAKMHQIANIFLAVTWLDNLSVS